LRPGKVRRLNVDSTSQKPDWMQRFSDTLTDVCILGVLWLLCSLPVVTVGAASAALYAVMTDRLTRGSRARVGPYFAAFRQHFRKATLLWLTMIPFLAVFAVDSLYYLSGPDRGLYAWTMGAVQLLLFAGAVAVCGYAFPLLAMYNQNIKQLLVQSVQSCYRHWPWTLLILAVFAAAPALILIGLWHFSFLYAGAAGYVISRMAVRIFP